MSSDLTSSTEDSLIDLDALTPAHQRWIYESGPAIHEKLVALLHELGRRVQGDETWWLSSISSRDPYLSPLYERCCRLALVEHLVDQSTEPLRVATCQRALFQSLDRWSRRRSDKRLRVVFRGPGLGERIRRKVRGLRAILAMGWELAERYFSREPAAFRERAPKAKVLVETFVSNDADESLTFFGAGDHYYPNLEQTLSDEQRAGLGILPKVLSGRNFRRIHRTCRRADPRCLIIDDALRLSDYLFVGLVLPWRLFQLSFRVEGSFVGIDIGECLRHEIRERLWHRSIVIAHLSRRFFRRAAPMGLTPESLISWNENQLVDKAVSMGVHQDLPGSTLVAYKSYPIGERYLPHLITTQDERLAQTTASRITLIGEAFAETAKRFDADLEVEIAPALRFGGKPHGEPANSAGGSSPGMKVALVVLPIPNDEIGHMTDLVAGACEQFADDGGSVEWRLKPHPKAGVALANAAAERLQERGRAGSVKIVKGSMADALVGVDVLVSNTSSACLEALVAGIEVAVVSNPCGLVFNPIPEDLAPDHWRVCFDSDDLFSFLTRHDDDTGKRRQKFPHRQSVFFEGTPDSMLHLLRMDGGNEENW